MRVERSMGDALMRVAVRPRLACVAVLALIAGAAPVAGAGADVFSAQSAAPATQTGAKRAPAQSSAPVARTVADDSSAASAAAPSQLLSANALQSFAQRELLRALGEREGHLSVSLVGRLRDIPLAPGTLALSARTNAAEVRPRMTVWVDITVNHRVSRSTPVVFDVQWQRTAFVARERLAARLRLSDERFELRQVNAASAHGEPVRDGTQLAGMRLRRELAAGAVLGSEDIEPQPPVEAGEPIEIYATSGRVVVRTLGIAQRDGFVGDRINARANGSIARNLRVQVVGRKRAEVIEDEKTNAL